MWTLKSTPLFYPYCCHPSSFRVTNAIVCWPSPCFWFPSVHPCETSLLDISLPDHNWNLFTPLLRNPHGFLQHQVPAQGPSCTGSHLPFWLYLPRCPIKWLACDYIDPWLHKTQPQALCPSRNSSCYLVVFPLQVPFPLPHSLPPLKAKFKCPFFHQVFHDAQTQTLYFPALTQ